MLRAVVGFAVSSADLVALFDGPHVVPAPAPSVSKDMAGRMRMLRPWFVGAALVVATSASAATITFETRSNGLKPFLEGDSVGGEFLADLRNHADECDDRDPEPEHGRVRR